MRNSAKAYVAHRTPTRVRFKLPGQRNDPAFFRTLEKRLAQHPSVTGVQANPLTASVLVLHEEGLALESLRQPFLDCWERARPGAAPARDAEPGPAPVAGLMETLPAPRMVRAPKEEVDLAAIIVDVGVAAITRQPPMRLIEWAATSALRAVIETARQPQARVA